MPSGKILEIIDCYDWLQEMWDRSAYDNERKHYYYLSADYRGVRGGGNLHEAAKDCGLIESRTGAYGFKFNLSHPGRPNKDDAELLKESLRIYNKKRRIAKCGDIEGYRPRGEAGRSHNYKASVIQASDEPIEEVNMGEAMEQAEDVQITLNFDKMSDGVTSFSTNTPLFNLPEQTSLNPLLDEDTLEEIVQERLAQAAAEQQAQRHERIKHRVSIIGWVFLGGATVLISQLVVQFL